MLPTLCAGGQQICQDHTCWLLVPGPVIPALAVFAWLLGVSHLTLLREYSLLPFRPPRAFLM
jgi:hypothetical protein